MDKWFDVHFSINGFMKIQGRDDDDAAAKAEEILEAYTGDIERLLKTGVGIEVADVVPEGSRADEGWYAVALELE